MISERSLAVLHAIVSDFVTSGEPVGSKTIVQKHSLGVSAATVRNDMAALEDEDLITAPHTSSGRVPTDKGYRLYVDTLHKIRPLSIAEKNAIERFLGDALSLEDMMSRTVRILANLTNQVAVIQYPVGDTQKVKHFEIVQISSDSFLTILITNLAKVDQHLLRVPNAQLTETDLYLLREKVNSVISGVDLFEAQQLLGELLNDPLLINVFSQETLDIFITGLQNQLKSSRTDRIFVSGAANLARVEEPGQNVSALLNALEEQVTLLRLMQELVMDPNGMGLSIGHENLQYGLPGVAFMSSRYENNPNESASLGILGPTRMDYARNIAAIRAVSRYLGRFLGDVSS